MLNVYQAMTTLVANDLFAHALLDTQEIHYLTALVVNVRAIVNAVTIDRVSTINALIPVLVNVGQVQHARQDDIWLCVNVHKELMVMHWCHADNRERIQ